MQRFENETDRSGIAGINTTNNTTNFTVILNILSTFASELAH
jgi:hypothetical protein